MASRLVCSVCGAATAERGHPPVCAHCDGVLRVERLPATDAAVTGPGLWRYARLLQAGTPVTLGEGMTPVVALPRWGARIGLPRLFAKLEYLMPTGSFKDRGTTVMVTRAWELGARRLVEDSSGNAGASVAAYAARAGLSCTIYAPAAAPEAKLAQITAAGATLIKVDGPREAVAAAAQADTAGDAYYAGHNTNPFFIEGTRTFAFEVVEQFDGDPPEHVIMPVGGGSLYLGAALGFDEWHAAGRSSRRPRLHIAQSAGCAPLAAAAAQGAADAVAVERRPTIAGGVTIERPARARLLLAALRETGGSAAAVDDPAILQAAGSLARLEGLACEPTSAVAFAALARLAQAGVIPPEERVLVAVTGSPLKDTEALALLSRQGR